MSAGTAAASAGLTAVGFSSTGIVGGSLAAAWQSSIGAVAAGSTFASLQSLGAAGTIAGVGTGAGLALVPIIGGSIAYNALNSTWLNEYFTCGLNYIAKWKEKKILNLYLNFDQIMNIFKSKLNYKISHSVKGLIFVFISKL